MTTRSVVLAVAGLALGAGGLDAQLTQPVDDATLQSFRWRSIGPTNMGGRVTDVEGLPSPSKTFYVAAAAGGIWKTTNNGTTFQHIWTNERVVSMGDLAIAPSDANQIWAGTGEEDSRNSISPGGGIFKSTDGGMTWEAKGLAETQVIGRIVVHPSDPDIVYVAALGHIWDGNPERGVYRTRDGGDTWDLVKFVSDKAGFVDIAMHPRDPDILFASSWERVRGPWFLQSGGPGSGLWKSTDGGDSWTEIEGNGFPAATKGRIGIAISPSSPNVVYALVEAEDEEDGEDEDDDTGGSGLYRSEDGGNTWEKTNDFNSRPFYYSQVRVDPADPDRVYFSTIRFSDDGGKTARGAAVGVHVDHHALWIDPNDPERMIIGNDGGIAITYDKGGNWQYLNNIPLGQFYHVSYNMDVPYRVCGGLQDNNTWCGPSRVANGQVGKHHWAAIGGGDGFVTAQDPVDHNLVWSESQGGNMRRNNLATGESTSLEKPDWRSVWLPYQDSIIILMDEGVSEDDPRVASLRERASADSAAHDMRWNWNTPLFQSVHDRSHFYAAGNMVVKSTDWGDGLEPISPDLSYADPERVKVSTTTTGGITRDVTGAETYATVVSLAESPLQQGMLFAGTDDGRVWVTSNDGGDWMELTDRFDGVPHGTYVSRIEPSKFDVDRFYVTFDGHRTNDFTPYVYATENGGRSFRSIVSNLPTGAPDFVHVIREDNRNENLLFVGTDVGAYVSTNRGGTWQRFMEGMPAVPVHDLEIHPRDRELIAGTHGRSIWIVDIAPLQEMTEQVIADGAALFEPRPGFQFGIPARGGESNAQFWFQRPTPGVGAEISYFIGEDLASDLQKAFEEEREQRRREGRGARGGGGRGGRGAQAGDAQRGAVGQGGRRPGGPPGAGGRGRTRGPQVEVTITDAEGEVVNTVRGPAEAGIHTVRWNLRGERPDAEERGPYETKERERIRARASVVADSLIEAGWDEEEVRRLTGVFTGDTDPASLFGGRGGGGRGGGRFGGGQAGRDPEEFRERPGEQVGGGGRGGFGGGNFAQIQEISELIMPGQGRRALRRRFAGGGGGGQAPLAEPGYYTITLKAGERTFTQTLVVERVGTFGTTSPSQRN